ncbi:unnamed protein product [Durusdinium trenchii]|uniref:Methyltransferase domain-containing protein n=1 Tax=Durusdinium trenchii TaxID=1381693 RepID=A0ABP0K164_9DINO
MCCREKMSSRSWQMLRTVRLAHSQSLPLCHVLLGESLISSKLHVLDLRSGTRMRNSPAALGGTSFTADVKQIHLDVLWDLGCGDGIVLVEAARRCGCRCVGLDIDGPCIDAARSRARDAGVDKLCSWLRCDMLRLPQGTLAGVAQGLDELPAATVALAFLTAHGLVRLARWLHQEWQLGVSRQLRVVTCVESLDSAVDFTEPDALFASTNELCWPVCRDLERWGVFVVPPFGKDVSSWSAAAWPLRMTRAEVEATQAAVLSFVLNEAEVECLEKIGATLLKNDEQDDEGVDLFSTSEAGFHKAAEAALHRLGQHRVLYLHSTEVRNRLGQKDRCFLEELEAKVLALMRSEDSQRWGLLSSRSVQLRSMEYHAYSDGGSVMDPEHRDDGSLVTISVLLSRLEDFQGGVFSTEKEHFMQRGGGVLFLSEKRHNVSAVKGERHTLVLELWDGPRNEHSRHD